MSPIWGGASPSRLAAGPPDFGSAPGLLDSPWWDSGSLLWNMNMLHVGGMTGLAALGCCQCSWISEVCDVNASATLSSCCSSFSMGSCRQRLVTVEESGREGVEAARSCEDRYAFLFVLGKAVRSLWQVCRCGRAAVPCGCAVLGRHGAAVAAQGCVCSRLCCCICLLMALPARGCAAAAALLQCCCSSS